MEHSFTPIIKSILNQHFGEQAAYIFENSLLIQYINQKTKSASSGSKSRASFANLYAIYVIIEDYVHNKFDVSGKYALYEGAQFSALFRRQGELPFGSKLQNHALNNRMNAEFRHMFPTSDIVPIMQKSETDRYFINENLLKVTTASGNVNIARAIIEIIDKYVEVKQDAFRRFIDQCRVLQDLSPTEPQPIHDFIQSLLATNADARLFEIVSYAILKLYYKGQHIIWGYDMANLHTEALKLYKTGRTNANDGGIDFVMRPLGRFFQVTETLDFRKYFLDIEKIERYPITFVIKTTDGQEEILNQIKAHATRTYVVESIVDKYLSCIEEIINIPRLTYCFNKVEANGGLPDILNEIVRQSKVEFNYDGEE